MEKIDSTVIRETKYIALWTIIFSAIMEAVFLIIGKWDYTVLLGNILSIVISVLNFLFMGITVQKALTKDEKEAKDVMKVSQMLRMLFVFVGAVIGVVVPCFNAWSSLIPLLFPRVAVAIRPLWDKKVKSEEADTK